MKSSNINISVASLGAILNRLIYRFGLLAVFIVIAIGIIIGILSLNSVIAQTDQANGYTPKTTGIVFDEATVQKIEDLKMDGERTDRVETSGRLLPF